MRKRSVKQEPVVENEVLDLVMKKDWEGLATLILTKPNTSVYHIIRDRVSLPVRMSALQIIVSSLRQLNDRMLEENSTLATKAEQQQSNLRRLETMRDEYMRKIKEMNSEIDEEQKKIQKTLNDLSNLRIESKEIEANLASAVNQQFYSKHLEETLNKKYTQWTAADVSRILEELNLGNYVQVFEHNNITGSVLSRLKSKMLMEKLGMSFREAKQLAKAIFFLQRGVSIHSESKGVLAWTNQDVCTWLSETKTAHLIDSFKANGVSEIYCLCIILTIFRWRVLN